MYPFPVTPQPVTQGMSDRDLPPPSSSTPSRDTNAFARVLDETVRETARDDRPSPPDGRRDRDDRADRAEDRPTDRAARNDDSRSVLREDNTSSDHIDTSDHPTETTSADAEPVETPPTRDTASAETDAAADAPEVIDPETAVVDPEQPAVATGLTPAIQSAETIPETGTTTPVMPGPDAIAADPSIAVTETGEALPSDFENPASAKAGVETGISTATATATAGASQAQIAANPANGESAPVPPATALPPASPANSADPLTTTTAPLSAAAQAAVQPKRTGPATAEPQTAADGAGQATDPDGAATAKGEPSFGFKEKTGPMGTTPTAANTAAATATAGQQVAGTPSLENPDIARPIDAANGLAARAETSAAATADLRTAPPSVTATQTGSAATSFANELRAAADIASAATNTAARTAPQPAAQQIAVQISRAAEAGQDRLTVNLKPAELGNVTIKLEVGHDNRIIAIIQAERPETLELLQRDARSLERAMAEAGLNTDSGSLNFGLKDSGADFMAGDQAGNGRTAGLTVPDIEIDDTTPTIHAPMADGSGVNINV